MASQRGPRCRKVTKLRDDHKQTRNRQPTSPLLRHMHSLAPLLSAPQSSRSNRISGGSMLRCRFPGLPPQGSRPRDLGMEGLGICVLTKHPAGPSAGALTHLTLKMPLTGRASSGDDNSQFWGRSVRRAPSLVWGRDLSITTDRDRQTYLVDRTVGTPARNFLSSLKILTQIAVMSVTQPLSRGARRRGWSVSIRPWEPLFGRE